MIIIYIMLNISYDFSRRFPRVAIFQFFQSLLNIFKMVFTIFRHHITYVYQIIPDISHNGTTYDTGYYIIY
jgi:hypothetical protein